MSQPFSRGKPWLLPALALLCVAGCRAWLAVTLPLTDTTEARFGEMARKMVETGDWLVPQHAYGVPYLAKPPLAFWLSAIGIDLDGAGEIGPRLLILVAGIGFCACYFGYVRRWLGSPAATAAVLLLATSFLFFVSLAAVMTDLILTICVCVALLAFWERRRGGAWQHELALYVALGCGLLAKGPLAVVLALAPIVIFTVLAGQIRATWHGFAWLRGALLALAIAAPWYVAAELRNPGFLDYFIVGEHIQRFLVPGWTGDLYGKAHDVPRGTIWLFLLIGALPWPIVLPLLGVRSTPWRRLPRERRGLVAFALAAALVPLGLFTLAGNVIFPYALPALPPVMLALAAAVDWRPAVVRRIAIGGALAAVAGVAAVALGGTFVAQQTQRGPIAAIAARHPDGDLQIFYWKARFFSAEYYSRGRAEMLEGAQPLADALDERRDFCLVVAEQRRAELPAVVAAQLHLVGSVDGFAIFEPAYAAREGRS